MATKDFFRHAKKKGDDHCSQKGGKGKRGKVFLSLLEGLPSDFEGAAYQGTDFSNPEGEGHRGESTLLGRRCSFVQTRFVGTTTIRELLKGEVLIERRIAGQLFGAA